MASYSSYKKLTGDELADGSVDAADLTVALNAVYGVKWFYGSPGACTPGCCCLWSVPTGVKKLHIQMWGAGGNGTGACSCNRCQHYSSAGGGYYNSKMITTNGGCSYSLCAAGVYPCLSRECYGCIGCSSYVNGYNLSNFCAIGGCRANANPSWSTSCTSVNTCCLGPTSNNGDFGMGNHAGVWNASRHDTYRGWCHQ